MCIVVAATWHGDWSQFPISSWFGFVRNVRKDITEEVVQTIHCKTSGLSKAERKIFLVSGKLEIFIRQSARLGS